VRVLHSGRKLRRREKSARTLTRREEKKRKKSAGLIGTEGKDA